MDSFSYWGCVGQPRLIAVCVLLENVFDSYAVSGLPLTASGCISENCVPTNRSSVDVLAHALKAGPEWPRVSLRETLIQPGCVRAPIKSMPVPLLGLCVCV